MLLNNTCKHQTETLFIFIYTITRCRSIYDLCCIYVIYFSLLSSFSSWLIVWSHKYRLTCSFAYFLEYFHFFLMIIWMKNVNNFQIAKIQPQCVCCLAIAWCFILMLYIYIYIYIPGLTYWNEIYCLRLIISQAQL